MTGFLHLASVFFISVGLFFFISGSIGLLRFPDLFCRLHAATKADTLGLGLLTAGLACRANDFHTLLLLAFIWLATVASTAVSCQLIARYSREGHAHPHAQEADADG